MPIDVPDPAPCAVEAKVWRECLKEFDYGPDRVKGACDRQRQGYYTCLKDWTNRTQPAGYSVKNFEMDPKCAAESQKLHECMMMSMFDVSRCQRDMALLKRCSARHNPEVRAVLADDPAIRDLESSVDDATGVKRLWYKIIGKL